jgi:hypothetical protein
VCSCAFHACVCKVECIYVCASVCALVGKGGERGKEGRNARGKKMRERASVCTCACACKSVQV